MMSFQESPPIIKFDDDTKVVDVLKQIYEPWTKGNIQTLQLKMGKKRVVFLQHKDTYGE